MQHGHNCTARADQGVSAIDLIGNAWPAPAAYDCARRRHRKHVFCGRLASWYRRAEDVCMNALTCCKEGTITQQRDGSMAGCVGVCRIPSAEVCMQCQRGHQMHVLRATTKLHVRRPCEHAQQKSQLRQTAKRLWCGADELDVVCGTQLPRCIYCWIHIQLRWGSWAVPGALIRRGSWKCFTCNVLHTWINAAWCLPVSTLQFVPGCLVAARHAGSRGVARA